MDINTSCTIDTEKLSSNWKVNNSLSATQAKGGDGLVQLKDGSGLLKDPNFKGKFT